jgi:hypothetical protein
MAWDNRERLNNSVRALAASRVPDLLDLRQVILANRLDGSQKQFYLSGRLHAGIPCWYFFGAWRRSYRCVSFVLAGRVMQKPFHCGRLRDCYALARRRPAVWRV